MQPEYPVLGIESSYETIIQLLLKTIQFRNTISIEGIFMKSTVDFSVV